MALAAPDWEGLCCTPLSAAFRSRLPSWNKGVIGEQKVVIQEQQTALGEHNGVREEQGEFAGEYKTAAPGCSGKFS